MNKAARILFKKGRKFEAKGNLGDAITAYEAALKQSPQNPDILFALGNVAKKMDALPIAEKMFRAAYGLVPDSIEAATNLALVIAAQGRNDEAIELYQAILITNPEHVGTWVNIGLAVATTGDLDNAEVFYQEALRLRPNSMTALTNYSELLAQKGDFVEALKLNEKALKRDKRNAVIRYNRGELLLALGKLKEGWDELDFGAQNRKDRQTIYHHKLKRWNGEDLAGKKILLSCEQGIADQVRYLSCVSDVIEMADDVVIEVEPRLVEILARTYPKATVRTYDNKKITAINHVHYDWPVDELDFASPMLNLYRFLKPDIESFDQKSPTLVTDNELDAKWKKKTGDVSDGLKVGICWRSGKKSLARSQLYTDLLNDWGPVLSQAGVTFFNLMYVDCTDELAAVKEKFGAKIITYEDLDYKNDLENVFSLTKQMDLVISVNSAPASFASVLGIATFVPSTNISWDMLGTDKMAMVPSMKPIIQKERGDWAAVMKEIAEILKSYVP
ncbi:MAG: tetratricopeptide repeat protein [Kordiimonadaceae bacterium]|nr:tetratricopeptide repeat protein [Kordiimonadaceae bacterium]MBT6036406.1 tetratricopeptide repeat protein [Kordiimonadaceae bacterium]MBT6328205.1 tetratricopeptide repeat protein [Kordiimonadaceae bacterium]